MTHKNTQFSVIMPVFNGEKTVETALDSIVSQTLQPMEVIIVNDGSTDKTYDVLKKWQENYNYIRVVDLNRNSGIVNALNIGASKVNADWAVRLDADDEWKNNHLMVLNDEIKSKEDLVLVGTCNFTDKDAGREHGTLTDAKIRKMMIWDNPFIHSSVAFSVEKFNNVGGYKVEKFEDFGLWLRLIKVGKVQISKKSTVVHNKVEGSLSDIDNYESLSYRISYQLQAIESRFIKTLFLGLFRCLLKLLSKI